MQPDRQLTSQSTMLTIPDDIRHPLVDEFAAFVAKDEFPCVGAKAALNRNGMHFVVARDLQSAWDDLRILPALIHIGKQYRNDEELFRSLVVVWEEGAPRDEREFESILWQRLQSLSDKDDWLGQQPDPRVSHDPQDPHFAMSFGGEAFFVVGLHPASSRPARRFAYPTMVFNLHDQFERLRAEGRYERLRETILRRDIAIAGSANPMLTRHGDLSAARQYSGRSVEANWLCPFSGRNPNETTS